jgi:hypothetical protein
MTVYFMTLAPFLVRFGLSASRGSGLSPKRVIWARSAYGMSRSHRAFSIACTRRATSSFS